MWNVTVCRKTAGEVGWRWGLGVETRVSEFPPGVEVCKAIFRPTPGFKEDQTFDSPRVLNTADFTSSVRARVLLFV